MKRYIIPFSISIIFLDQITKYMVSKYLTLYESIEIIAGKFNITYIKNRGGAFGILGWIDSPLLNIGFLLLSILALIIIILLIKKADDKAVIPNISFSLVLGGALGNMIDRIRIGEVIDFLDIHWNSYHWPAFNIADSAITIGMILLIFDIIRRKG